jgi:hypothetical protein
LERQRSKLNNKSELTVYGCPFTVCGNRER